jgi:hypothetical protein
MTAAEIAPLFRCTTRTLLAWSEKGLFPRPLRIGRKALWRRAVIEALLREGRP